MTFSDDAHFTLSNIPFGVAAKGAEHATPQIVTRLREHVYFIPELIDQGLLELPDSISHALKQPDLNDFAGLGRPSHREVRNRLQSLLSSVEPDGKVAACRSHKDEVRMLMPIRVGDFSDFSLSRNHVLNAGLAVFGVESLPPGFLHFPVGYTGRTSSIVISGTPVRRPLGQFKSPDGVVFGPSKAMDYELEVACVVGKPSEMGKPVLIDDAMEHVFGFVLLNDWSARDIQGLEMNPLGPFNGKSTATTISPWIVTVDALEPFKASITDREIAEAPYLKSASKQNHYAVHLRVDLVEDSGATSVLCNSQLEWMYWTFKDMIAHQTINGCAIRSGDLLATGTVSGRAAGTLGCLLEITKGGKETVKLSSGNVRRYLEDGDSVRLTGWAGELGSESCVGFGESFGRLEPALNWEAYGASKIK
ncbi:fumarylacetoacetase [Verruconis gallopava]|uniref:Fumarylacetoacetase n=1 Tax=Verruconis gallopava TaxID=253628 RepID=A0A0D1XWM8_9PEZI|nr:fumarylacetoacetase [Verruconis gallopava]KIW07196.1 fumarylacetoacetase [Verruconis gallopava]